MHCTAGPITIVVTTVPGSPVPPSTTRRRSGRTPISWPFERMKFVSPMKLAIHSVAGVS